MGTNRHIEKIADGKYKIVETAEAEITYGQLVDAKKTLEERRAKMLDDVVAFENEIKMVTATLEKDKPAEVKAEEKKV